MNYKNIVASYTLNINNKYIDKCFIKKKNEMQHNYKQASKQPKAKK